jgi:autotransporter-associated beta strand protein
MLTGGTVTFSPKKLFFGAANADGGDLALDAISETAPTAIVTNGSRTLFLNGNDSFTGGLTINSGTVQLGNPGALNSSNPNAVTLNGGGTVIPRLQLNGNSVTVNGLNSSGGGSATTAVVEDGSATTAATLTVNSASSPAFDGILQNGAAAALSLAQTGAGTFTLTGNSTYTGSTTIGAGGTLRIGAGGTAGSISGTSGISGGSGALVVFNRSTDLNLAAPITGSIALTQAGSNVLTLSGVSNYSGDTNINSGTLRVTGGLNTSGAVQVNSGGTLAGNSAVGNVTLVSGANVHPGATAADGSAGTLTMTTLTVNGGDYRVDVGGDLINVNGLAHFTAPSSITPVATVVPGTYTVLTAGTLTIDPGQNPTVNQVSGARESFSLNLATPNTIKLDVVGAVANLIWKGNLDAGGGVFLWDVQGTKNWTNTSSGNIADFFYNSDNTTFNDSAANKTVTINSSVSPGSVVVSNSTGNDYTFTGGSIDGTTSLVKSGAGALTLSNSNTYSGGTILNTGTLNANNSGALGTGAVTVNGGTLNLGNANAMSAGTLTINGGTLDNTSGSPITLTNNNVQVWGGSFTFLGSSDLNLGAGAVTMNVAPTITVNAGTLIVGGTISDNGAGLGITKAGAGVLELDAINNSYSGPATVTGGTLSVAGDGSLGTPPATVTPAAITLNGGALQVNTGTAANSGAGNATLRTTRGITLGASGGTIAIGFVDQTAGVHLANETALVYNGVITGPGGLTVTGIAGIDQTAASILDLSAVATYQGNTTISNAIVQVNSGNTGTNNGAAVVNILPTGTTLNLINNGAWNIDSVASNLTVAGLTGDSSGRFGTSNQTTTSSLTLGGAGTYSFPGVIGAITVAGKLGTDTRINLIKSGSGTQILSGPNTYSGTTTISGGILSTPLLNAGGLASGIGSAANTANTLVINGGTLQYTGPDVDTDRGFTLGAAGGTLDASGDTNSALNMSNTAAIAFSATTSPVTLTLTGSSTGANTLAATIGNPGTGANVTTINKTGAGTWILSSSSTYSGNTTISGGTLGLSGGSTNNIPGSPRVSIGVGATLDVTGLSAGTLSLGNGSISQTLAAPIPSVSGPPNSGAVSGSLEIISGSAIASGSGSILTVSGGVTLDSGSVSSFALGVPNGPNNAATSFVNITGAGGLTVTGTHLVNLTGTAQPGTYELYAFTNGAPTADQFQIGANSAGNFLYTVGVTANQEVDLTVQIAPALVWTGATNNAWDTTTANWNSLSGLFTNGASAQFDDSNVSGHNTIAIDAAGVSSTHVIFANSTQDYSINGPGAISGTAPIDKSGSGTVTINVTNNTNTGATTITGGTLAIAADGSLGTAPGAAVANQLTINGGQLTILGSTTLAATRGIQVGNAAGMIGANATTGGTINVADSAANLVIYNGIIANVTGQAGILNKDGLGELDLGGVSTFSGGLNINSGAVKTTVAGAQGNGTIRVGANGTFATGSDLTVANAVTLAGGTIGGSGADRTINGDMTIATFTTSTVDLFDPTVPATRTNLFLVGTLHGSGNINVQQADAVTNPDNQAFRLRGPASSDYTGTITVGQAAKFELQTTVAAGSPAGTGTIIVTGGTIDTTNIGTFSIFNVRDNSTGDTVFGNNVEMAGSGSVLMNMLGTAPAGTTFTMGNLKIGDTQDIIAGSTGGTAHTLKFNSVELTGGTAAFSPQPVGNSIYVAPDNILLGPISEDVAGSGILANGVGSLTLTGTGSYTGSTTVQSGTLVISADVNLGTAPAVSTAGQLTVNGGQLQATGGAPVVLAPTRGFTVGANGGTLQTDSGSPLTIPGITTFANSATTLNIAAGSYVKFNASSNAATVAAGSSVTVATGATLELAGTASALSDGTSQNSVNVVNNSSAAGGGLLVSGTSQKVGNIDGTGTTQVNGGSDLTANHIVQGALIIGGDATHPALVTIVASDVNGNSQASAGGFALAGSLASSAPLTSGTVSSPSLLAAGSSSLAGGSSFGGGSGGGINLGGGVAAVPEPSTLLMALFAVASLGLFTRRKRN